MGLRGSDTSVSKDSSSRKSVVSRKKNGEPPRHNVEDRGTQTSLSTTMSMFLMSEQWQSPGTKKSRSKSSLRSVKEKKISSRNGRLCASKTTMPQHRDIYYKWSAKHICNSQMKRKPGYLRRRSSSRTLKDSMSSGSGSQNLSKAHSGRKLKPKPGVGERKLRSTICIQRARSAVNDAQMQTEFHTRPKKKGKKSKIQRINDSAKQIRSKNLIADLKSSLKREQNQTTKFETSSTRLLKMKMEAIQSTSSSLATDVSTESPSSTQEVNTEKATSRTVKTDDITLQESNVTVVGSSVEYDQSMSSTEWSTEESQTLAEKMMLNVTSESQDTEFAMSHRATTERYDDSGLENVSKFCTVDSLSRKDSYNSSSANSNETSHKNRLKELDRIDEMRPSLEDCNSSSMETVFSEYQAKRSESRQRQLSKGNLSIHRTGSTASNVVHCSTQLHTSAMNTSLQKSLSNTCQSLGHENISQSPEKVSKTREDELTEHMISPSQRSERRPMTTALPNACSEHLLVQHIVTSQNKNQTKSAEENYQIATTSSRKENDGLKSLNDRLTTRSYTNICKIAKLYNRTSGILSLIKSRAKRFPPPMENVAYKRKLLRSPTPTTRGNEQNVEATSFYKTFNNPIKMTNISRDEILYDASPHSPLSRGLCVSPPSRQIPSRLMTMRRNITQQPRTSFMGYPSRSLRNTTPLETNHCQLYGSSSGEPSTPSKLATPNSLGTSFSSRESGEARFIATRERQRYPGFINVQEYIALDSSKMTSSTRKCASFVPRVGEPLLRRNFAPPPQKNSILSTRHQPVKGMTDRILAHTSTNQFAARRLASRQFLRPTSQPVIQTPQSRGPQLEENIKRNISVINKCSSLFRGQAPSCITSKEPLISRYMRPTSNETEICSYVCPPVRKTRSFNLWRGMNYPISRQNEELCRTSVATPRGYEYQVPTPLRNDIYQQEMEVREALLSPVMKNSSSEALQVVQNSWSLPVLTKQDLADIFQSFYKTSKQVVNESTSTCSLQGNNETRPISNTRRKSDAARTKCIPHCQNVNCKVRKLRKSREQEMRSSNAPSTAHKVHSADVKVDTDKKCKPRLQTIHSTDSVTLSVAPSPDKDLLNKGRQLSASEKQKHTELKRPTSIHVEEKVIQKVPSASTVNDVAKIDLPKESNPHSVKSSSELRSSSRRQKAREKSPCLCHSQINLLNIFSDSTQQTSNGVLPRNKSTIEKKSLSSEAVATSVPSSVARNLFAKIPSIENSSIPRMEVGSRYLQNYNKQLQNAAIPNNDMLGDGKYPLTNIRAEQKDKLTYAKSEGYCKSLACQKPKPPVRSLYSIHQSLPAAASCNRRCPSLASRGSSRCVSLQRTSTVEQQPVQQLRNCSCVAASRRVPSQTPYKVQPLWKAQRPTAVNKSRIPLFSPFKVETSLCRHSQTYSLESQTKVTQVSEKDLSPVDYERRQEILKRNRNFGGMRSLYPKPEEKGLTPAPMSIVTLDPKAPHCIVGADVEDLKKPQSQQSSVTVRRNATPRSSSPPSPPTPLLQRPCLPLPPPSHRPACLLPSLPWLPPRTLPRPMPRCPTHGCGWLPRRRSVPLYPHPVPPAGHIRGVQRPLTRSSRNSEDLKPQCPVHAAGATAITHTTVAPIGKQAVAPTTPEAQMAPALPATPEGPPMLSKEPMKPTSTSSSPVTTTFRSISKAQPQTPQNVVERPKTVLCSNDEICTCEEKVCGKDNCHLSKKRRSEMSDKLTSPDSASLRQFEDSESVAKAMVNYCIDSMEPFVASSNSKEKYSQANVQRNSSSNVDESPTASPSSAQYSNTTTSTSTTKERSSDSRAASALRRARRVSFKMRKENRPPSGRSVRNGRRPMPPSQQQQCCVLADSKSHNRTQSTAHSVHRTSNINKSSEKTRRFHGNDKHDSPMNQSNAMFDFHKQKDMKKMLDILRVQELFATIYKSSESHLHHTSPNIISETSPSATSETDESRYLQKRCGRTQVVIGNDVKQSAKGVQTTNVEVSDARDARPKDKDIVSAQIQTSHSIKSSSTSDTWCYMEPSQNEFSGSEARHRENKHSVRSFSNTTNASALGRVFVQSDRSLQSCQLSEDETDTIVDSPVVSADRGKNCIIYKGINSQEHALCNSAVSCSNNDQSIQCPSQNMGRSYYNIQEINGGLSELSSAPSY